MGLPEFETVKGDVRIAEMANAISDAINLAMRRAVPPDVACSVAAQVVADYGRGIYGPDFCEGLAEIIRSAPNRPMPSDISRQ